jgi:hypothetical protein
MVESGMGLEGGDMTGFHSDASPTRAGMNMTWKCVSCGQAFVCTVGKGPDIDALGNKLATWRVVTPNASG